ncbi:hypothetical protein Csa_011692 [Cucumis sativus]|uniref:Uncharacterized protein n=1 Tax=Cucumis sativus TaxID=3659 RepID=A0A0A0L918_CUCSA|nr:hypothetical protein Csa_011692 [Cucumis sativus]
MSISRQYAMHRRLSFVDMAFYQRQQKLSRCIFAYVHADVRMCVDKAFADTSMTFSRRHCASSKVLFLVMYFHFLKIHSLYS